MGRNKRKHSGGPYDSNALNPVGIGGELREKTIEECSHCTESVHPTRNKWCKFKVVDAG